MTLSRWTGLPDGKKRCERVFRTSSRQVQVDELWDSALQAEERRHLAKIADKRTRSGRYFGSGLMDGQMRTGASDSVPAELQDRQSDLQSVIKAHAANLPEIVKNF